MKPRDYRGKTLAGKWVYGDKFEIDDRCYIVLDNKAEVVVDNDGGWLSLEGFVEVIPESVGQYTGEKTKEGAKIYENDVLESTWGRAFTGIVVVVFFNGIYWVRGKDGVIELTLVKDFCRIIANRFDNPELLKEQ